MTISSDSTDPGEALRVLFKRLALEQRTATPAVVVAVDPSGRFVDVQPAISGVQRLDDVLRELRLPVLRGVPLQLLGSTSMGLFVAVPVTPGDDGLLIVSDRALDNWQYGGGVSMPPEGVGPRQHDLTDAVFIPGMQRMSGGVPGFPTSTVQMRNRAGNCVAEVGLDTVHATTPDGCEVTLGAGVVRLEVPGGAILQLSGDTVTITGKLVVSDSIAASRVAVAGSELYQHDHGGVAPGGSRTNKLPL